MSIRITSSYDRSLEGGESPWLAKKPALRTFSVKPISKLASGGNTMSEPYIGQIMMIGFNYPPQGWAFCDGQLIPVQQNPALFSLLSTTYGGDGYNNFALPDLRGRVAIHQGQGPGLTYRTWGERGGYEAVALTAANVPAHTHTAKLHAKNDDAGTNEPSGAALANSSENTYADEDPDAEMRAGSVTVEANTGGDQPHTNMQPYLCINFVIALTGAYPPRN
jgi:microcystin-dependent protein